MTLDPRRAQRWFGLGIGPLWIERSRAAEGEDLDKPERDEAGRDADPELAPPARQEPAPELPAVVSPAPQDERAVRIAALEWEQLREVVSACTACPLCKSRKQAVFGVGFREASWMFVGEAPGAEEDQRGEPFVGQAGRLLDNMLAAAGLTREGQTAHSVYIANVLKCRPPGNRNPEPAEVAQCEPFLIRQVQLVQPKVIVVMGRFAAQVLLRTDATIASLRGRVHHIEIERRKVPVVVTYHPAYLLRNLADKAKSWADLCLAREVYEGGDEGAA